MPPPFIHKSAFVGEPFRHFQGGIPPYGLSEEPASLSDDVWIGAYVVIGKDVHLGRGVVIDHYCMVEAEARIGENSLLIYRAVVGCSTTIGKGCVIGGLVCERCVIEDDCRIFGQIVHKQLNTAEPWDEHETPEPSAVVKRNSFIGFGAIIAGGVTIGPNAYVAAGAILTRDVPPGHIAFNRNQIIPVAQWKGELKNNPHLR